LLAIQDVPKQQHAYLLRDFHAVRIKRICSAAPPRQLKKCVLRDGRISRVEDLPPQVIRETQIDPSLNGTLKGNHQLLEFGFVDIWERLGQAAMSNGVLGFTVRGLPN